MENVHTKRKKNCKIPKIEFFKNMEIKKSVRLYSEKS